jgi:hypothetical protein
MNAGLVGQREHSLSVTDELLVGQRVYWLLIYERVRPRIALRILRQVGTTKGVASGMRFGKNLGGHFAKVSDLRFNRFLLYKHRLTFSILSS